MPWNYKSWRLKENPSTKSSLALYEAAVASYKGSLLEDFDYAWCQGLRVNYQSYFVTLCRKLTTYHLEQQHNAAALSTVSAWLKHEPYDEEAHGMALKLYHMTKGKTAATTYFRNLCRTLKADLGTKPGAALKELYADLINS